MNSWGNDSFDTGAAGGWGDVSYAANEPAGEGSRSNDKVAVPVSIADLNQHISSNDEKISFGKASFSTVRVVGVVKNAAEQDGGQSIEYRIGDTFESEEDFLVIHYKGVVNVDAMSSDVLVEGTTVSVVGKLRNFDNRLTIVAFDVREVEDKHELEAFRLQTKLAKLYYTKDALGMIKANPLRFDDIILRTSSSASGAAGTESAAVPHAAPGWGGNIAQKAQPPVSGMTNGTKSGGADNARGLVGQKAEIYKYLLNLGNAEGTDKEEIRRHIPKANYNPRTFNTDFDSLLSEGHIYSTIDDDHYTAN